MKALSPVALTFLALTAATAQANGLIQKLPKDGSWVRYHMTIRDEAPEARERTATVTVRSVGEAVENGEKCRWIEMEMQGADEESKSDYLFKGLIPEKDLRSDTKPASGALRGWQRHGPDDGTVTELDDSQKSPQGILATILPGSRNDTKQLDEKKGVEYQQGRLECKSGLTGTMTLNEPSAANLDVSVVYSVWPHEKVPFGVAAARYEMTAKRAGKVLGTGVVTFTVEDFGDGAKSALPDRQ